MSALPIRPDADFRETEDANTTYVPQVNIPGWLRGIVGAINPALGVALPTLADSGAQAAVRTFAAVRARANENERRLSRLIELVRRSGGQVTEQQQATLDQLAEDVPESLAEVDKLEDRLRWAIKQAGRLGMLDEAKAKRELGLAALPVVGIVAGAVVAVVAGIVGSAWVVSANYQNGVTKRHAEDIDAWERNWEGVAKRTGTVLPIPTAPEASFDFDIPTAVGVSGITLAIAAGAAIFILTR
ncbi:MAG: hypothetical protein AAFP26_01080 [Planctomycetota bacterium]